MTARETLDALLPSFRRYYDVEIESEASAFAARAAFHTKDSQYFLVKRAQLSHSESHEYVYFSLQNELGIDEVKKLADTAWTEGLSQVDACAGHRNTDIVLIILAERISKEAADYVKSLKRYKSYAFTFRGWSNYGVIALETSTGAVACNRYGRRLKGLLCNIK